jgi:ketosteroid isomerase-like protein
MKHAIAILIVASGALALTGAQEPPPQQEDLLPAQAVSMLLDQMHDGASQANSKRYLHVFAPDAVFMGTDASERWTFEEFRGYAIDRFQTGTGWTYRLKPGSRHVFASGDFAWFDELLDNLKYGTCRGTGVARKVDGRWKITQYSLALMVPNGVAEEVVKVIREKAPEPAGPATNP